MVKAPVHRTCSTVVLSYFVVTIRINILISLARVTRYGGFRVPEKCTLGKSKFNKLVPHKVNPIGNTSEDLANDNTDVWFLFRHDIDRMVDSKRLSDAKVFAETAQHRFGRSDLLVRQQVSA